MHIPHRVLLLLFAIYILAPAHVIALDAGVPYEQEFILTAYYSPLPDQCCYVKGSYEADKILNGEGIAGADGTPVYPGMLAAPPAYKFGTRIVLPGLGTMTVHDRGGAIQEWDNAHRLDVWAGYGEEGLARALAFGIQEIRGMVYPLGTEQPNEAFALETLPAPEARLKPFMVAEAGLLNMHPKFGSRGLSVTLLQEQLKMLGYFEHEITGLYGDVTQQSLEAFIKDMGIDEPSDSLTQETAAYLTAAVQLKDSTSPVTFIGKESSPSDIMKAQRMLRYLGFYKGRTNGEYSETLFKAILAYQQAQKLVGDAASPGAGRIGPMTKGVIDKQFRHRRIAERAKGLMAYVQVRELLQNNSLLVNALMQKGANGSNVKSLQKFLAQQGFFPADKINGNYGELTARAVVEYQLARQLLASASEKGAGTVGPITLNLMKQEQVRASYRHVRAQGWDSLTAEL
jgi:peptidoglycan hydrolase-like protein with peptidoglycan-binding domain